MTESIIFAALLPVALLIAYILIKDKNNPEPAEQLIKAFVFGILSVFVSLCISTPLKAVGLYTSEQNTLIDCIRISFFGAAIPEEIAKFLMLWLCLRRNRFFDEKMDGIVYAAFVSLGFAAFENVMYLFGSGESWVGTGIARGLLAVPGHFLDGILMGYYFSLARFYPKAPIRNKILTLAAPILAHGIYDTIAFSMDILPGISLAITILLFIFCYKLWKYGSKSIKEHLERDGVKVS